MAEILHFSLSYDRHQFCLSPKLLKDGLVSTVVLQIDPQLPSVARFFEGPEFDDGVGPA